MRANQARADPRPWPAIITQCVLALALFAAVALAAAHPNSSTPTGFPAGHGAALAPAMVPADCQCGGPGGSADLAHISPWLNPDCASYTEVGRAGVHAYKGAAMTDTYVGWVQWVYSSNRSCRGYQWLFFHLIMGNVAGTTAAPGFAVMLWITPDPLDWTTFTVNYGGGQADGTFQSVAVLAGPLSTSAGVWSSLTYLTGGGHVFTA